MSTQDEIKNLEKKLTELKEQAKEDHATEVIEVSEMHEDMHRLLAAPKQNWMLPVAIVVAALIVGGAVISKGRQDRAFAGAARGAGTVPQVSAPAAPAASPAAPGPKVAAAFGETPILNKNTKVQLIEFGDFQCPFCGRFYTDSFIQIKQKYIDTGKIAYQHRDYPLPFHQNAQKAAEAARCALEQKDTLYWQMHDWMYKNQNALETANLKNAAKTIGANSSKFDSCLDSGKYAAAVKKDYDAGSSYGVSGTPSFFLNGEMIVGAQPYATFEQKIEAMLAAK